MEEKILEQIEQSPKKTMGGARPNSGPKKGAKYKKTIEKEAAIEEFRKRVRKGIDKLYNAQFGLATGLTYVYEVVETVTGSGKNEKTKRENVLVTSPIRIKEVLDELDSNEAGTVDDSYYFITTEKPDNRAIDSLMDRAFGKSQQTMDVTSGGEPIVLPNTLINKNGSKEL